MTVYLDSAKNHFGRMKMCHMVADSLEELHTMAESIGMKRQWFQQTKCPHYDVCLMRRTKAVENGARVVSSRELIAVIKRWKKTEEGLAYSKLE